MPTGRPIKRRPADDYGAMCLIKVLCLISLLDACYTLTLIEIILGHEIG